MTAPRAGAPLEIERHGAVVVLRLSNPRQEAQRPVKRRR